MKIFLIIASPRTGSTLLTNNLRPYCSIGEPWTIGKDYGWDESRKNPGQYLSNIACNGFFSDGSNDYYHCVAGVFGAKIHTFQLNELRKFNSDDKLISAIDYAILLRRKNLTEQAISYLLLNSTVVDNVTLNIAKLKNISEKWVSEYQYWSERIKLQLHDNVMSIWYEDMDADAIGIANKTRQFLNLPELNVSDPGMKKVRSYDQYRKVIKNYDRIVKKMGDVYGVPFGQAGTRWDQ